MVSNKVATRRVLCVRILHQVKINSFHKIHTISRIFPLPWILNPILQLNISKQSNTFFHQLLFPLKETTKPPPPSTLNFPPQLKQSCQCNIFISHHPQTTTWTYFLTIHIQQRINSKQSNHPLLTLLTKLSINHGFLTPPPPTFKLLISFHHDKSRQDPTTTFKQLYLQQINLNHNPPRVSFQPPTSFSQKCHIEEMKIMHTKPPCLWSQQTLSHLNQWTLQASSLYSYKKYLKRDSILEIVSVEALKKERK